MKIDIKVCVWQKLKSQLILLFNLFLLLFISSIALFGTIYGFHCTISVNFYLYLQYFQQKIFSFSKTNESQTEPKWQIFFFFFFFWGHLRVSKENISQIQILHKKS